MIRAEAESQFLYHLCAPDMRGSLLYPLNELRQRLPDVYAREREKWAGRESVLEFVVPGLGVPWANTVNLSTLDPRLLVEARARLGVPVSRLLARRLVRIPLERLAGRAAVRLDSQTHWINSSPGEDVPLEPPSEAFSAFDPDSYEETLEVPPLHLEYLERQRVRGQVALGFVFVPHVLVAGSVDLSGLQRVEL